MSIEAGTVLWKPDQETLRRAPMSDFAARVADKHGVAADDYEALWRWSVDQLEDFWGEVWDYFDIQADGSAEPVLASSAMPGAQWFPNARLNYAEHIFRRASADRPALILRNEAGEGREVGWAELAELTGAIAARLRALGVGRGDRVVSYMPNIPHTIAAFLATASIGAIWSSCAQDMGPSVVLDRFRQIEPKVIFAIDSYRYNGKLFDRSAVVAQLLEQLPTVEHVIHVRGPGAGEVPPPWRNCIDWETAVAHPAPLAFERVPFDHPLWIVYSSGTTGLPKAMVHGHGGIVLTHLKTLTLQHDLREGDRMLFLAGTGWVVWNLMVGGLLTGATMVLYDGNPAAPDGDALWRFIDEQRLTHFGCGAAYLINCMKDGLRPKAYARFEALRSINATGSPLPLEAYEWVHAEVKQDIWLASISGGTDIASGFVACSPTLPVHAGEIQCRELGVAAYAFNDAGEAVVDEVGELVITKPMPSMPLFFWNDPDNARYLDSYFDQFPGVWRHGDWIRFTTYGSSVIYGRSDSTINRHGIRMGTAEIYRVVEDLPEIRDALVVDLEYLGRESFMPLFVVLRPGHVLDDSLRERIRAQIRSKASPRHVPNEIYAVDAIPHTLTGKKMEVPVRKLLLGADPAKVTNPDTMSNPASIGFFIDLATRLNADAAKS
jgi:acetoacetyl-CoA synthetase